MYMWYLMTWKTRGKNYEGIRKTHTHTLTLQTRNVTFCTNIGEMTFGVKTVIVAVWLFGIDKRNLIFVINAWTALKNRRVRRLRSVLRGGAFSGSQTQWVLGADSLAVHCDYKSWQNESRRKRRRWWWRWRWRWARRKEESHVHARPCVSARALRTRVCGRRD